MISPGDIQEILNALDWKQEALADHLGVEQSNISKWLNRKSKPGVAAHEKLQALLAKVREVDDVRLLRGPLIASYDPDEGERRGVGTTNKGRHKLTPGAIAEIVTRGGAGGGGYAITTEVNDEGAAESYAADAVKAEWIMPPAFVRNELGVSFGFSEIVTVDGDSMEPDFRSGDRVVVDRLKRGVKQGGVFAIRDGEELLIKQVELVRPAGDPPRILVTSRNSRYAPYELALDGSVEIIGRVAGRISRV